MNPPDDLPTTMTADGNDVTVIIVNWNGGEMLATCVKHLQAQTTLPARVLVVDNASLDNSLAQLPPWDRLTVLRMPSNLGFAAGNNRALEVATTHYVALLNPDAFAAPDWIEQLLKVAQAHPEAASIGSRQLCHEAPAQLDGTGDCYHLSGLAWREGHGQPQQPSHLIEREIFAPCAAAALYRRHALQEIGGFDERFFCYMEDVDAGFRLRLAGHTSRYAPQAWVTHVGSATSGGKRSSFATYHGHRNMIWTYIKNMPGPLLWALLPLHLAANIASLLVLATRGQGRIGLQAKWHALLGARYAWQQRRHNLRNGKASVADIWRALDKRPPPLLRTPPLPKDHLHTQ